MAYRDELGAAHARIHALEQELAVQEPEEEMKKCHSCNGFLEEAVFPLFVALGIFGCIIALWISHGDLGKCYIEDGFGTFDLNQEVHWGADHNIGGFKSLEAAVTAATRLKCPLVHEAP